ncbi:hypothetical protein Ancab_005623, partial [Ancistrocladus abbreviatus]
MRKRRTRRSRSGAATDTSQSERSSDGNGHGNSIANEGVIMDAASTQGAGLQFSSQALLRQSDQMEGLRIAPLFSGITFFSLLGFQEGTDKIQINTDCRSRK